MIDVENHDIMMDHNFAIVENGEIPGCSYTGIDDEATQSGIPMSQLIEDEEPFNERGRFDRAKKRKGKGKTKDPKTPRIDMSKQ